MTSLHSGSSGIAGTTSEPTTTESTMATGLALPPPTALEIHEGNVVEKWKKFHLAWSNNALATVPNKKSEPVQVATLLTATGEDARNVYSTFDWMMKQTRIKLSLRCHSSPIIANPAKTSLLTTIILISRLRKQPRAMTSIKQHLDNSPKAVSSPLSHPRRY